MCCPHAMLISPIRWLRWAPVLAVCLSSCAETTVTYTQLNVLPNNLLKVRKPEQIQVFSSTAPDRPHLDVGLISVQEGEANETPASLIEVLRRSGAERGCDALLLAPPSSTTKPTGLTYFDNSYQVYSATCIVYLTAEPGDVGTTFAPAEPSSTTVVDPQGSPDPTRDRRRSCRDRRDFDQNRNCVLDNTKR